MMAGKGEVQELTLEATVGNLAAAIDFAMQPLEELGCPMKLQLQMQLAIEEIFVNIANYAYAPATGSLTLRRSVTAEPPAVTMTFIDSGVPYNPLAKPDPDVSLDLDEREIGGLGIFLTKKVIDDIAYEYKDGQNILRLHKKLQ